VGLPFHVVIPARYAASRLPGKPLLDIGGRPLIRWVWESARNTGAATVIVATDDDRVAQAARSFGADVELTSPEHASGTDRLAEVVRVRGLGADEIVVNLQGDEPLMPSDMLAEVASALIRHPLCGIATAAAPIGSLAEFVDPNCVKALVARDGTALYFSRAPVPWPRDHAITGLPGVVAPGVAAPGASPAGVFQDAWRHIGIYAYRVKSLLEFAGWPPTPLESIEKLEQLRALEYGMRIHVLKRAAAPPAGVDTPEDLERVRSAVRLMRN
jgi:3-deoxy-manno-octulosonate cytidylyltransferase (CMP-KDO synthetase)